MRKNAIRPLEGGDFDRVKHLVETNKMFPPAMLEQMTQPYFSDGTSERWLVFDDGQVDAACYYAPEEMTDGVWNLLMIAVDPDRHGEGLGSALMAFVEAQLANEGLRMLLVDTSGTAEYKRTRGFYDMLGYEREARIRDYWAVGDDKVTFRKVLN